MENFSDIIYKALDNNQIAIALFLDLSRAFDTIDHSVMLAKLYRMGFRGPFYTVLKSYFTNRFQMVKLNGQTSDRIKMNFGVPQGSTLGPLLFNIYINDIGHLKLKSNLFQYADDTALILPHEQYNLAAPIFQNDIVQLMSWFKNNCIFVNRNKTKLMCFRSPYKQVMFDVPIFLHDQNCDQCDCEKMDTVKTTPYLGLHFDENVLWSNHIDHVIQKLRVVSAYLYRLKSGCDVNLRREVYLSLGESVIRYGITIYGTCPKYKEQKIDSIINRCVSNIVYGSKHELKETKERKNAVELLSFENVFKFVVLTSHYFSKEFKEIPNRIKTLRHTETYAIPKIYTNYGKKQRNYYVPAIFNSLPKDILSLSSKRQMYKKIKEWCFLSNGNSEQ